MNEECTRSSAMLRAHTKSGLAELISKHQLAICDFIASHLRGMHKTYVVGNTEAKTTFNLFNMDQSHFDFVDKAKERDLIQMLQYQRSFKGHREFSSEYSGRQYRESFDNAADGARVSHEFEVVLEVE